MLGIPEWAVGVGVICVAFFGGVTMMVRLLPESVKNTKRRLAEAQGAERLEELERRMAELEGGQQRVAEIEERLDFAERLLAKRRDAERLAPPKS